MLRSVVTRVLALDIGTSSVRAQAYDDRAEPVEGAEAHSRYELEAGGVLDSARMVAATRADWLLLEGTGELRTSVSMASATGLWTDEGWDGELLDALGIDPERLPPVSDEPVDGRFPALGDGACSNVGAGCTTPDRAALTIGTSGALRVVTGESGAPPPGLFRRGSRQSRTGSPTSPSG